MDTRRGAEVYRAMKAKEEQVLQSNQVKLLQFRIKELEDENRLLKRLLKEK